MVTFSDNDTDSAGSLDLDVLDDIITSLSLPPLPSCDLGDKPTSIATELKTNGTKIVVASRTKINDKNYKGVIEKFKEGIDNANTKIEALKKLAAEENKQRLGTYDATKQHANALDAYLKTVMKKVNKLCEDNKRIAGKLRDAKEEITKLRDGKRTRADDLKEVKRERDELKREKKTLMDNIGAQTKIAQDSQKTISRHEKTIERMEGQLLKKGGGMKEDGDELSTTQAKNQAKLEATYNTKMMDLHFKDMENTLKANSKSNRFFGSFGGGGMGMMGIQNMWSNAMGMRAQGHGGIGGMGRYGNSPAFHPYPMEHQRGGPSYHSSSYHAPHDRRSYESPSYYRGDRRRHTPSSRDYGSHRRRYRSRSRTPQRRRDYTPNRYYEDRRHGGHLSPRVELNRGRFELANNGNDDVDNSGKVPHDSGVAGGTGSNDSSAGTSNGTS